MCGRLSGADDASDRLASFGFFRPGMNDQDQHRPNKSDGVPSIAIRVRVWLRRMQRVVEHQHRGFE